MKLKQFITIFGILILVASLGLGGYFAYSNGFFTSKNNPAIQPTNIKISNINHDRFSISWISDEPTNGSVIFGQSNKLDQLQIDDNDQLSGQQVARRIHHVTLVNLDPETTYQFKIRSGEKNTIFDDNGKPFTTTTAAVLSTQPPADLINGSVTVNGKSASDSIVYITIPGMTLLSTQVKKDGTWLVNLANARNTSLAAYATYDPEKTNYEIFIQGEAKTSKVLLTTANDSPVPDIVLGEMYDFTKEIAQVTPAPSPIPESTQSARLAGQFPLEPTKEASLSAKTPEQFIVDGSFEILNPFENFEELHVQNPEFRGTGAVGTVLSLKISDVNSASEIISTSTTVDSSGLWTFTPRTALEDGDYKIELGYVDEYGEQTSIDRSFSITAAAGTGGTTPAYTASTSGSRTTPTPRATIAPRKSMPSTASGTPTSGFELPTIIILLLGFGLTLTGLGWKNTLKRE